MGAEHDKRYELWQSPEVRRRFLSDEERSFDKAIAKKLDGHWHYGDADYKAAGVSESDYNKYREIRRRLLDHESGVMAFLYRQDDKWKALCEKYKLSDLPYDYKEEPKRDNRKQLQQVILKTVKDNKLKKKPLLAFLRSNNPEVNSSAINRQLNN